METRKKMEMTRLKGSSPEHTVEVTEHSVNQYIERVIGVPKEMVGDSVREWAEGRLRDTAEFPDDVYHEQEDNCPIHIRKEIAAPVERGVVKTAYKATTFRSKMEDAG